MPRFLASVLMAFAVVACGSSRTGDASTPNRNEPSAVPMRTAAVSTLAAESSCTIGFASPGETCGDHGECPERVHRSLFWGLIEYDTDVTLCFCLIECEVDIPLLD